MFLCNQAFTRDTIYQPERRFETIVYFVLPKKQYYLFN
jgi:hypothetical protein